MKRNRLWSVVPLLLLAGCQQSPYAKEIADLASKEEDTRHRALFALQKAGPAARDAIPALKQKLDIPAAATLAFVDPTSVEAARMLVNWLPQNEEYCMPPLLNLGETAAPILGDALLDDKMRPPALRVLLRLGTKGKAAAPKLIELIRRDREKLNEHGREELFVAGRIGADPAIVVPIAIEMMKKSGIKEGGGTALNGIIAYGPEAKVALPVIRTCYRDDEFTNRWVAAAIIKLDPEDSKARRVLIHTMGHPHTDNLAAKYAQRALIENDKRAIPDLEEAIANPTTSEETRKAAREVLGKIRSP